MKKLVSFVKGTGQDIDFNYEPPITPLSRLIFDGNGKPRTVPFSSMFSGFEFLPSTSVAAATDPYLVTLGTNTEVVARSPKGGINVKTETSVSDNDNAIIIGVASTKSFVTVNLTAGSIVAPRFRCRVNLATIASIVFGAGLDENITNPVPSATAGDGAAFYFDPGNEASMGLASGAEANWVLTQKKAGTDTYVSSGIPVVAGKDYELEIRWDSALKPSWYIDGVLIATSTTAQTDDTAIGINIGIQINGSPVPQGEFDLRYVQLDPYGSIDP